jgi:hypothetical protein
VPDHGDRGQEDREPDQETKQSQETFHARTPGLKLAGKS